MNALTTSINSTIVRSKISLRAVVRAYFAIASRVLPDLARRHAEHLFTAPPHYAGRGLQPVDARRETVVSDKHLPDFVRALQALAATHGPFAAAIGHSLGAAGLGVAMRRGLKLGRVVFVSPPASISEHAHKFARLLGITPPIREAMRHRLEHRYGVRFAEIDFVRGDVADLPPHFQLYRARRRSTERRNRSSTICLDSRLWMTP